MAEYPPGACTNCPPLVKFAVNERPEDSDYLKESTVPNPDLLVRKTTLTEPLMGVSTTYDHPDLKALNQTQLSQPQSCCLASNAPGKQLPESVLHQDIKPAQQRADPQPEMQTTPAQMTQPAAGDSGKYVERPICYLPQPEDLMPAATDDAGMGPLGPWATGRVDWGPLSGLTGTRPVVDKYSIARYSEGEWRAHNSEVLNGAANNLHRTNMVEWNSNKAIMKTSAETNRNQAASTKRLRQREQEIYRWKCELERAILAAAEEITLMSEQRTRLRHVMVVLQLPESIASECLERRTGRLDPELVRDSVEEELIKELSLTAEIREVFSRTLKNIEHQLLEDTTAKQRLEYDWSDKKQTHEMEALNIALNNRSTVLLFKPGAVGFPDNQSTYDHWVKFTRETLEQSEATRQRSVALRGTLDAVLINASRDLRSQADRVDLALSKRIACTEAIRIELENNLSKILQRLADVENFLDSIRQAIRNLDTPIKLVQTRLENRLKRPRVENCRDDGQFELIEEMKILHESGTALSAQLKQAEKAQAELMKARSNLEREIMIKRKTLEIDRDRTQMVRSHYPSANALSGY